MSQPLPSDTIKIIAEQAVILNSLDDEERTDYIRKILPPSFHIRSAQMFSRLIGNEAGFIDDAANPGLPELLLRKIISIANSNTKTQNCIIPLIPNLGKKSILSTNQKTGGAFARKAPPKIEQLELPPNALAVSFDSPTVCQQLNGRKYVAPPKEIVIVLGMKFKSFCRIKKCDDTLARSKLIDGRWGFEDLLNLCHNTFFRTFDPSWDEESWLFDETRDKLERIFTRVLFAKYAQPYIIPYLTAQLSLLLKKNTPLLYNRFKFELPAWEKSADTKIEIMMREVYEGALCLQNRDAVVAQVDGAGYLLLYELLEFDLASARAKKMMTSEKSRNSRKNFRVSFAIKELEQRSKLNAYLAIIEQKFGIDRRIQIEDKMRNKPAIVSNPTKILDLLADGEKGIVTNEKTRKENYILAYSSNKCEHRNKYRIFVKSKTDTDIKAALTDLESFFKPISGDRKLIECNVCGFEIMCQHTYYQIKMELDHAPIKTIQEKLSKFISDGLKIGDKMCVICGQRLTSIEDLDVEVDPDEVSMSDTELRDSMWKDIAMMVNRYLKFSNVLSTKEIITAIRDACYKPISDIERLIAKSKTNTVDEAKAKSQVYISIYTFAYMIRLVLKNPDKVEFRNPTKSKSNTVVELIKFAINSIVLSKNVALKSIPDMNTDVIKNKIVDAYKFFNEAATTIVNSESQDEFNLGLYRDSLYIYTFSMLKRGTPKVGSLVLPKDATLENSMERVFGASTSDLVRSRNLLSKFAFAKFPKNATENFYNFPTTLRQFAKLEDKLAGEYSIASYELYTERIKDKLFLFPMYQNEVSNQSRGEIIFALSPEHAEAEERYEKFASSERALIEYRQILAKQPCYNGTPTTKRGYKYAAPKLGNLYDEKGKSHNWSILIMEEVSPVPINPLGDILGTTLKPGKHKTFETNSKKIIADINEGVALKYSLVDKKCSICGVKKSESHLLNEESIVESIRILETIDNFFTVFEVRCPLSKVHQFSEDKVPKCKICGFVINTKSAEYFEKYKPNYDELKIELENANNNLFKITRSDKKYVFVADKNLESEIQGKPFDYNSIIDLANKTKVDVRILMALGNIEKQKMSSIISGEIIPRPASSPDDVRISAMVTHLQNFVMWYNQLRYHGTIPKPTIEMVDFMSANKLIQKDYIVFDKLLPDIADVNEKIRIARHVKKSDPQGCFEYLLQLLAEISAFLWDIKDESAKKVCRQFVIFAINRIVKSEDMLSQFEMFNWAIIFGDKNAESKNEPDDLGDDGGEGDVDDEVEAAKPFSDDAFDFEKSKDDIVGEDVSNQIRVEGHGD